MAKWRNICKSEGVILQWHLPQNLLIVRVIIQPGIDSRSSSPNVFLIQSLDLISCGWCHPNKSNNGSPVTVNGDFPAQIARLKGPQLLCRILKHYDPHKGRTFVFYTEWSQYPLFLRHQRDTILPFTMRFRRIDSFRVHLAQSLQTFPFTLQLFPLSLWTGHLVPGGLASEDSRNLQSPDTEEPLQLQRLLWLCWSCWSGRPELSRA